MTSQSDLAIIRHAYARQIAFAAGSDDPRLERALAAVPREDFLGPGPWDMPCYLEIRQTPDADPAFVYRDSPIALSRDKHLNNGQPSYVSMLIHFCAIRAGDHVVHVGTGTGYFTALLSHLVEDSGRLLGIEREPDLARRAASAFAGSATTQIVEGDGFALPLPPADAILVNAGTPRFAATWLDALKPGGRLVVPLAYPGGDGTVGVIVLIIRDADGYSARCKIGTSIYPCIGASDPAAEAALQTAIAGKRQAEVARLRRTPVTDERTWLRGDGWSLTYD